MVLWTGLYEVTFLNFHSAKTITLWISISSWPGCLPVRPLLRFVLCHLILRRRRNARKVTYLSLCGQAAVTLATEIVL